MNGSRAAGTETVENNRLDTRNSSVIMFFTLLSRILGVIRISVISSIFGASGTADVINFTFTIPNNLRKMLAEGALSSAFIPVLTRTVEADRRDHTQRSVLLVRQMMTLETIVFIPLGLAVFLFSEQIIRFLSDFTSAEMISLAALMLRYLVIYLLLISLVAIIHAVLHCSSRFTAAAASPITFSISVIGSMLLLSDRFGALSFLIGVVCGGLMQFMVILPALYRTGFGIGWTTNLRGPDLKAVITYWLPVMLTSSVAIINQQVAFFLASGLQEGSITAFSNSIIFWQLPYGLFFNAIVTVYFPKMSSSFHRGDMKGLSGQIEEGIKRLLIFLLPSALLLITLQQEFVASILYRGAYSAEATILTSRTLAMFSYGLVVTAIYHFLTRLFYSIDQFRSTVHASVFVAVIDIGLSLLFISRGCDVSYLALAHTLSFLFGCIFLLIVLRRTAGSLFPTAAIIRHAGHLILLLTPLTALCVLYHFLVPMAWWIHTSSMMIFLYTSIASCLFGLIVLLCYRIGGIRLFT
ncbi:MAG: murein biosynthesis integral membrane protein MurJ [Spirochaetia bacterium]|nr:murein biosynthesis integral membrane protein MurJ [Spirochaetia bacterium]